MARQTTKPHKAIKAADGVSGLGLAIYLDQGGDFRLGEDNL